MLENKMDDNYSKTGNVETYYFERKKLCVVERSRFGTEYIALIPEFDLLDLISGLEPSERINLRKNERGLYETLRGHNIDPDAIISNPDLAVFVLDNNCRNLTQTYRKSYRAWKLIKERGLEEKIFKK